MSDGIVEQVMRRLVDAGLLSMVRDVRAVDRGGIEIARVSVSSDVPAPVRQVIVSALVGLPFACVDDERPVRGTVLDGLGVKDGRTWRLGDGSEILWIQEGTEITRAVTAAIPAVFDSYATLVIPDDDADRQRGERSLLDLLAERAGPPWVLGYLDTGAHDVVFDGAPRVELYTGWPYVLVEAGPEQAATWREDSAWRGRLPDLMFPVDRSWLVSMLWDDDWRCLGGPADLVDAVLAEPVLQARRVRDGEDATPPVTAR